MGLDAASAEQEQVEEARNTQQALEDDRQKTWWKRYVSRRDKPPHSPGKWVVYFSLAALPLFGFGQWFIPADDGESRQYAFQLLMVYVASGLGLLLTTSFLGLRRYLRQRRLEMPNEMTVVWLGAGAILVVGTGRLLRLTATTDREFLADTVALSVRLAG